MNSIKQAVSTRKQPACHAAELEIDGLFEAVHYWPRGLYWSSNSHKRLMRLVAESSNGSKCLDLGCGTARYRSFIEAAGLEWFGADIVFPDAKHLQSFRLIENNRIPFEANEFGMVCLFNVVEHFTEPESMFSELRRVTAPGGLVFGAVAFHEHEHGSFFHLSELGLKTILTRHGFAVDSLWPSEYSGMVYTCQRFFGGGGRIVWDQGWKALAYSSIIANASIPFFVSACFYQFIRNCWGRTPPMKDAATIYFSARRSE